MRNKAVIKCPFCGVTYSKSDNNVSHMIMYTSNNGLNHYIVAHDKYTGGISQEIKTHPDSIILFMCVCPNCKKTYSYIKKVGKQYSNNLSEYINISPLIPINKISKYSKYVPKPIFNDYKEAYSILNESPQSSATLSRRILEEIIENYFHIENGTLFTKINKLFKIGNLDEKTINTLHALRRVGNIGAHMKEERNKIVRIDNPGEAEILLKMVELLFNKTYVESFNNKLTEHAVKDLEKKYYN